MGEGNSVIAMCCLAFHVNWVAGCSGGSRISPRRGCQLPRGVPTYDFAIFSRKLHVIERIWAPGGGMRPSCPPYIRHWGCAVVWWHMHRGKGNVGEGRDERRCPLLLCSHEWLRGEGLLFTLMRA